jgi:hypothetical protein
MKWKSLTLALVLGTGGSLAGAKVYVFFPSLLRPNAIQSAIADKCSGLDVTVFGRLADFQGQMTQSPPDAVVAPRSVLEQYASYKSVLKGSLKGATSEPLVLLAVGKTIDDASLAKMNLGVVGFLDRSKLGGWVNSAVGAQPKLKNVTKIEDLLPLLTFQSADAVLVQESAAKDIKTKSQANLVETKAKGRYELVGVAAKDDAAAKAVEAAFKSLGAKEKAMLGVDGWSK